MMRRRRSTREARERWVYGRTAPLARLVASQPLQAMITPRADRIIDLVQLAPGKRYLDIGCGTATYAHLLANRAGLDDAPVTMDLVGAPFPVDVLAAPEHLPFANESFDCITSLYYIHRFDDDAVHGLGREIRRILAPGGAALVMDVAPVYNGPLNRLHTSLMSAGCVTADLRGWGRLAALFTEAGYDAIDLVNVGPFFLPPVPRVGVLLRLGS
jgi:SAM-dependent methyltransferase